ncbi:hypothetical protein EYF80_018061 [Liparis tanakae]|uniref:Uncharacterized protein n=1 Tax=Liparis tanakae TaxID=230148 RepID=A0A4Z2I1L6_9TELE|nr:hypothetical protein EYF80_018061 [Liparis tanakae]
MAAVLPCAQMTVSVDDAFLVAKGATSLRSTPVVQLSPLSAMNGECYFGYGFLKMPSPLVYSNVSQGSSFHWLGLGGLLVTQGPVL